MSRCRKEFKRHLFSVYGFRGGNERTCVRCGAINTRHPMNMKRRLERKSVESDITPKDMNKRVFDSTVEGE
jgi:hypothetical protein